MEDPDGSISCQPWPSKHAYLSERFDGALPINAVAIVHTHPVQFPRPSYQDQLEATRMGVPIYVITIQGVFKAVPRREQITVVSGEHNWFRNVPTKAASGVATASP
jgi:proteasome lid subunit RPN8/RPN11